MEQGSQKITGDVLISPETDKEVKERVKNIADFQKIIETSLKTPVTKLLEIVLAGGIVLEASDIHIEPQQAKAKLRIRIDGILQDVMSFDLEDYQSVLNRLKLLSGLKLNISDRPQDGRFSIETEKERKELIEIRTSTIPAEYGESIVLRILNPKSLIELEGLGLRKDELVIIKKEIEKPNGMIIVTGPTGSGKTTTLYAFLKRVQKPEIKIITIEDPIEYHLKEISQTQVNPKKGYDFATGLKSILRQDPDVILVGEIRDPETCQTGLQAALTGHLVLTTLHTNDAVGTIARLINLGAKPSDIGPAANLVIAQRLIRKVCEKCSRLKTPSKDDFRKIKTSFASMNKTLVSPEIKKTLKGISEKTKIPTITKRSFDISNPRFAIEMKGCKDCNFTGYQGRIGIFEIFLIDDEMEKFILTQPSTAALKERVAKKGMVTMYQDGLLRVLEGTTTIEEVERVAAQ